MLRRLLRSSSTVLLLLMVAVALILLLLLLMMIPLFPCLRFPQRGFRRRVRRFHHLGDGLPLDAGLVVRSEDFKNLRKTKAKTPPRILCTSVAEAFVDIVFAFCRIRKSHRDPQFFHWAQETPPSRQ